MTSTRAFPAPRAWLTIIVCALPLLGGCSSEAEPAPEPPRVALVEPLQAAEPKAEALRFSGVVQSVTSTQLSFEVAGRIERILVDEGTRVRRGQPLAQLDRTDYRLQLREAEARLRQLEADLARKRTLLAEGILAPAAIEALQANTVAARVARDSAQRRRPREMQPRAQIVDRRGVLDDRPAMDDAVAAAIARDIGETRPDRVARRPCAHAGGVGGDARIAHARYLLPISVKAATQGPIRSTSQYSSV